jgi:hypothetical protein
MDRHSDGISDEGADEDACAAVFEGGSNRSRWSWIHGRMAKGVGEGMAGLGVVEWRRETGTSARGAKFLREGERGLSHEGTRIFTNGEVAYGV